MQRFLLIVSLSVFFEYKVCAQVISINPDTTYIETFTNIFEVGFASIYNNSSDTLNLRWHRISESVFPFWVYSICDINTCHGSEVDSADFIIPPYDSGYIELMIDPNMDYGSGIIKVLIYDPADAININASAIFIIHVTDNTAVKNLLFTDLINFYPNPSFDFIAFKNISIYKPSRINIYNSSAQLLVSFKSEFQSIDIRNLATGKYYFEIIFDENKRSVYPFIK